MLRYEFEIDGRKAALYGANSPELLIVQPVGSDERGFIEGELPHLSGIKRPFAIASFVTGDWNTELSPWKAEPVFGSVPFGDGAGETLEFILDCLMPAADEKLGKAEDRRVILGGYSLAGLFSLWAACNTDVFSGIAAVSPSVWFTGWIEYVKEHEIRSGAVYLSLGNREEKTRNRLMSTVGDRIRELYDLIKDDHAAILEWNEGNHFHDAEIRTAKGLLWLSEHI